MVTRASEVSGLFHIVAASLIALFPSSVLLQLMVDISIVVPTGFGWDSGLECNEPEPQGFSL